MKISTASKMTFIALLAGLILSCSSTSKTASDNSDPSGTATSKDGSYGTGSGSK